MIKSYKEITGKYLKSNKKRTVLTIIGVILSVALISSIGLFFKGIEKAEIEGVKTDCGSYHLAFINPTDNLISKITNNPKVSRSGFINMEENIKLTDKFSINKIIATDKALELLPYRVKEGRFPNNKNEIAIENWMLKNITTNTVIGKPITINGSEYILVGILEDRIQAQIQGIGVLLTKDNNLSKQNITLYVEISSKTNLKVAVKELKSLTEKDMIDENLRLLVLERGTEDDSNTKNLLITLSIIIGIVVLVTIAVIYNAFQISVVERIKQFGLLRAIGTTPRQIRKIVLREASVIAIIGVPIGLIFGIFAIHLISLTFKLIGGDSANYLKLDISPMVLEISSIVGIVSIYISALIPAFFAGRISPLTAISSRDSIKKEKFKKKRSLILGKLLGFEGAMASKNIKRNKKRYRITVFSILISVMLFITFKSFMDMTLTVTMPNNESKDVNFSIERNGLAGENANEYIDNNLINNIKNIKSIDKFFKVYPIKDFQAVMDKSAKVKEVDALGNVYKNITYQEKNSTLLNASISTYDNAALQSSKKYLEAGSIDINKLNNENGVIVVNRNVIHNSKSNKDYWGGVSNLKVGDEILLQLNNSSDGNEKQFGKGSVKKVKVMAILNNDPFDFNNNPSNLNLITSEDISKKLLDKESFGITSINIGIKNLKDEKTVNNELENQLKSYPSFKLINQIDQNRNTSSTMLMFEILLYGFVIVVSLIGSVNIINTLTTNIILRRREFATLKSIGLTQKGLRKMIILEGLLYGIMGSIYGSIIGSGLSYLIFKGMYGIRELSYHIPWNAILIASSCSLLIGYLSVLSPLARIKKDNLIDTIREE